MEELRNLRYALDSIMSTYVGERVVRQSDVVEELKKIYRHTIKLEREAVEGAVVTVEVRCFEFALGLTTPERDLVRRRFTREGFDHLLREFLQWLIEQHLAEVDVTSLSDGDLVVYYDDDRIKHVGRVLGGRVNFTPYIFQNL